MDFRNLTTFVQVAELCSFTRAAEKLGYSQSTISFQIKQLEKELSVQLFERIGHTVQLTDDGRDVLVYAQEICRISQEMAQSPERRNQVRGLVRLAMSDSMCSHLMDKSYTQFHKESPDVSVKVITAGTTEMYRLLDHNEVDAVCTLDNHIYNTTYIIACEQKEAAHFVCAADHPFANQKGLDVRQLLDQPFLLTEKGMSYRRLMDERMARESLEIQPVLEMGSTDQICRLVGENHGISFLPDFVTERDVRAGKIVRMDVPGFEVDLWKQLVYHRDKWMSKPLKAVLKSLSSSLME